ncbi:MAG: cytochrome ubiquinol oxidase subunit I [Terriglobales bacterium]|jgi:mono/diheme cytochrome c family protein
MNYPIWHLGFPGGLLIAAIAVLHVFISHFAVGGGAYLVLTERRAYARNDAALLRYIRHHSKFFALLTVVLGAVTGVGIWFTIGLVSPEATSSLIHTFVWGWAIEWVFFFVEIAAALIYAYHWDTLDRRTHLIIGWIYFVAAWASLVVINGIITYMLTPGRWLETKSFWDGYFNPTYWPSLCIRTAMAVGLAGIFGLVTAMYEPSPLRERVVRWSGWWLFLGIATLLPLSRWYFNALPSYSRAYFSGTFGSTYIAVRHSLRAAAVCAFVALFLTLVFALLRPKMMNPVVVCLLLIAGIGVMGSGEYLREFSRYPYVINGYIYANDIRVSQVEGLVANGIGKSSPWVQSRVGGPHADPDAYAQELFITSCGSCHSVDGYRGMRRFARGWDAKFASELLLHLPVVRPTMPPFSGDAHDRAALGGYLASLAPATASGTNDKELGQQVFAIHCALCHSIGGPQRPLDLKGTDPEAISGMLGALGDINPDMPPFTGTDAEGRALAAYLSNPAH